MEELQKSRKNVWNMPQATVRLFHAKCFAKAEVSEYVENEIVDLMSHVERLRAVLGILFDEIQPAIGIGVNKSLDRPERFLRERLLEDTPFASMRSDVCDIPGTSNVCGSRPDSIVVAFSDVAFWAKDGSKGVRCVNYNGIRAVSESWACTGKIRC